MKPHHILNFFYIALDAIFCAGTVKLIMTEGFKPPVNLAIIVFCCMIFVSVVIIRINNHEANESSRNKDN